MASIDERVVAMSFENDKFEEGVAQTLESLQKLDDAIKTVGHTNGLGNIEADAKKVTLDQPMSAVDKLKAALSKIGDGAATGFSFIANAAKKITFAPLHAAADGIRRKLGGIGSGSDRAFASIEKQADSTDFSGLSQNIDGVKVHFGALRTAAAVAFGTIINKATNAATHLAKEFTLQPLIEGFQGYEKQINATQTIMANTGLSGQKGLQKVEGTLKELQKYANLTVYNFSDMAKNIGTFTAAGVDLKTSTSSIKGIANLAALSGSTSQQASGAMYQLSQAIAAGKVNLQDWNSVVNAGIGGKVFQKTLVETAQAMGTLGKGAVKTVGPMHQLTVNGESFRQSISAKPGQTSYLTSGVLTKALSTFTGDMSAAQLQAQGFDKATAKALSSQGKVASNAATQIKTFAQMMDALKEETATAFSAVFKTLFGNLFQARDLFSKLHTTIENAITGPIYSFNKILEQFDKLGGRKILLQGLKSAWQDVEAVAKPVLAAFREIFPPTTARGLLNMVKGFKNLADSLRLSPKHADELKRTFAGLFAVVHIGVTIVGDIVKLFAHLLGFAGKASGGILGFTGGLGDMLVALDKTLTRGKGLQEFFQVLTTILSAPITILKEFAGAIAGLFGGDADKKTKQLSKTLHGLSSAFQPLTRVLDKVKQGFAVFTHFISGLGLDKVIGHIGDTVKEFVSHLAGAFLHTDYSKVFNALSTGLIGGILLTLRKGFTKGLNVDLTGGALKSLSGTFRQLTGTLHTMQQSLKAGALLKIAEAIGLLAISLVALSFIDPKKLSNALTAMAFGFGELLGVMHLMTGFGVQSVAASTGLILLAGAMDILAVAIYALSRLNPVQLVQGLTGVAGALAILIGATRAMKGSEKQMITLGYGLTVMGVGLNVIAAAIAVLGNMRIDKLYTGLLGIAGAIASVALGLRSFDKEGPDMVKAGAGLVVIGAGLTLISAAVERFSQIPLPHLVQGLLGLSGAMLAIAGTMDSMPKRDLVEIAGSLVLVGFALNEISGAVAMMGALKPETLVKGLVGLGGALGILAVGLKFMKGSLEGTAALVGLALALDLLAPAIALMGNLKWDTLLKGLAAVAISLGIISAVGAVAAEPLAALGVALGVLGIAAVGFGAAIFLAAKGISLLSDAGQKGVVALGASITLLVASIPKMIVSFVQGLLQSVDQLIGLAPKLVVALGVIIDSLTQVVVTAAPKLAVAITALIGQFLIVVDKNAGPILKSGIKLLETFLEGVGKNISKVTDQAATIIVRFLRSLSNRAPDLVRSGATMLVSFLKGIENNLTRVVNHATAVAVTFLNGIADNVPKFVAAGTRAITSFLDSIANAIPRIIKAGGRIVIKFIEGIGNELRPLATAATDLIVKFIQALTNQKNIARIVNAGFKGAIHFIDGIRQGVTNQNNIQHLITSAEQLGWAIVKGVGLGLVKLPLMLAKKLVSPFDWALNKIKGKDHLDSKSPSKFFIRLGNDIVNGMAIGLQGMYAMLSKNITNPIAQMVAQNKDAKELGKFLGHEFLDGLTVTVKTAPSQSQQDVINAFSALRGKMKEETSKLHDQVKADKDKLNQLLQSDKPNQDKVNAAWFALQEHQKLLASAKSATAAMLDSMKATKKQLTDLAGQYDALGVVLQDKQAKLEALRQSATDLANNIVSQYNTTPDFNPDATNQVSDYTGALTTQITTTEQYMKTLQKLRDMGLDDTTYQKLLDMGTSGEKFAEQLVAAGAGVIQQINDLDKRLSDDSHKLALQAAANLYAAGISVAQGIVDGIKGQQKAIEDQMTEIADALVNRIKRRLGIRSPSRVMAEVGKFAAQGVIEGLKGTAQDVATAAASVGDNAASAMSKSLSRISDAVGAEINPNLTLTPVLDLTQVRKDAKELGDITNVTPITAAKSYTQASAISAAAAAAQAAQEAAASQPTSVTFEQNNYSPEALSPIVIYRQTRNQLAQAKSALGLPA